MLSLISSLVNPFRNRKNSPDTLPHLPKYVDIGSPTYSSAMISEYLERDYRRREWYKSTSRMSSTIFELLYPHTKNMPSQSYQQAVETATIKYLKVSKLLVDHHCNKIAKLRFS
ncbi:hypothetical protein RCL1_004268 [Eukaryota sp. TZLM3-RCL]